MEEPDELALGVLPIGQRQLGGNSGIGATCSMLFPASQLMSHVLHPGWDSFLPAARMEKVALNIVLQAFRWSSTILASAITSQGCSCLLIGGGGVNTKISVGERAASR